MDENEPKPVFDYRAISDKIHTDYEQTLLAKKTALLMGRYVSRPDLDQLRLRSDR